MAKSDLSRKVADRYRHDQLRKAIVVSRWLLAKGRLAPGLKAVQNELQTGEIEPAIRALDNLWMVFEIHESPGEIGTVYSINAEWYYPLGPRYKVRIKNLIWKVKDLRRSLTWDMGKQKSPDPSSLKEFEEVTREAAWLENILPKVEGGFPHGGFTIIPMKGVSSKNIDDCLGALDKASGFIRAKFPQVLYGKVYLGTSVGRGYGSVAQYVADHDTVSLSIRTSTTVGDVHAICHELGHRFFHKFWKNKEQRDAFYLLSVDSQYETVDFDKATREKLADEFISNSEKMREGGKPPTSDLLGTWITELKRRPEIREIIALGKKFTWEKDDSVREKLWSALALSSMPDVIAVQTDKKVRGPLAVTPYGGKDWKENFAEAFAFYAMGKPLPPEIASIFDALS
jgi:hypothetical protein